MSEKPIGVQIAVVIKEAVQTMADSNKPKGGGKDDDFMLGKYAAYKDIVAMMSRVIDELSGLRKKEIAFKDIK